MWRAPPIAPPLLEFLEDFFRIAFLVELAFLVTALVPMVEPHSRRLPLFIGVVPVPEGVARNKFAIL